MQYTQRYEILQTLNKELIAAETEMALAGIEDIHAYANRVFVRMLQRLPCEGEEV